MSNATMYAGSLVLTAFDWAAWEYGLASYCGRQDYPFAVVEKGIAYAREHYSEGHDLSYRQIIERVS